MTTWGEVEAAAPELAAAVQTCFQRAKHKTMATLRRDGSPRISGMETEFVDGQLTFGMMPGSVKLADVQRDPRVALHSPSVDPPEDPTEWPGEAKVSGRARSIAPPGEGPEGSHFGLDVTEVVLTRIAPSGDKLVIESWTPGGQVRRVERT
ncbi:pyridoxamine 5'-phosphate oxidase family protein [Actinomycetospora termitidis]|uniref:Pyridoxamine 5'-phosphate oxidase family protein n=1 Tax=Actinomycetospora termitidis TaxID=3053470 RepID=A0ABT7MLG0_9PSEU|nr:pyridoxamine 5'-phosphate oxidase family protein [Actinomycetospora sp. Odt1-22]MDL5160213.1 pyridoxamine 5'-phosphate oxidase family protein [Actinomycetospora sp. Odt1-22]